MELEKRLSISNVSLQRMIYSVVLETALAAQMSLLFMSGTLYLYPNLVGQERRFPFGELKGTMEPDDETKDSGERDDDEDEEEDDENIDDDDGNDDSSDDDDDADDDDEDDEDSDGDGTEANDNVGSDDDSDDDDDDDDEEDDDEDDDDEEDDEFIPDFWYSSNCGDSLCLNLPNSSSSSGVPNRFKDLEFGDLCCSDPPKCRRTRVRSSKYALLLEDPTHTRQHFQRIRAT